jgi:ligand-binding SRPBCC domain-containing protein
MQIYVLRSEMWTSVPLRQAFSFFEDPYNLAKITPQWLNFQVTSPQKVEMRKGTEIEYTIRWMNLPIHWKTIILEYQPPNLFTDEQAKGPYSLWRHTHNFERCETGTRVGDRVDYALPFGFVGRFAHCLIVRKQLLRIFRFRQEQIGKLLGGEVRQILQPTIHCNNSRETL